MFSTKLATGSDDVMFFKWQPSWIRHLKTVTNLNHYFKGFHRRQCIEWLWKVMIKSDDIAPWKALNKQTKEKQKQTNNNNKTLTTLNTDTRKTWTEASSNFYFTATTIFSFQELNTII